MSLGNVDYWRTIREFDSNASVIADQAQDVVTFRSGDNIRLSFNEGDDIITWHADLDGAAENLKANLSVVNSNVTLNPSMLDYDNNTGTFTYFPPDLDDYATIQYVDDQVASGVGNIDLSEYATEKWVQGYVGTAVNIPDLSEYVRQDEYNEDLELINQAISDLGNTAVGYTGSRGNDGSSVKIVGSVETYNELITRPRWTNYLGQKGDGVILEDTGNLAVATIVTPYPTTWEDVGPIIGYTGSQGPLGFTGSKGVIGYTGSAIIVGHFVYEQNVASDFWSIQHDLGVQYLSAELIDLNGNSLVGTYSYPTVTFVDDNNCTVEWAQPSTGILILSAGGGETGFTGSIGGIGYTGSQGDIGYTGSSGAFAAVGFTGSRGVSGYTGSQGIQGFSGSKGDTSIGGGFVHTQTLTSTTWTVNHNLDAQYVNVEVIDADGNSLVGTYSYPTIEFTDNNTATLYFRDATAGFAAVTSGGGQQGAQGIQGPLGYTGSQGVGFTGSASSVAGPTGFSGSRGFNGYTGSQGLQGITGFGGSRGDTGFGGSKGVDGPQGPAGTSVTIVGEVFTVGDLPNPYSGDIGDGYVIESTGNLAVATSVSPDPTAWNDVGRIVGFTGSQGDLGFTGSTGGQGDTGFAGSQGDTGFNGSIGDIGFTGSKGDTGFNGSIGDQGIIGFTGSKGDTGFNGSIGFTGSKGDQGNAGTSVNIVGSVATSGDLDPAYSGSVGDGFVALDTGNLWVWDGSQWDDVGQIRGYTGSVGFTGSIGFTGSRGDTGFTGSASTAQGPIGFTGSKGDTGFTGSAGFTGSQGDQGTPGVGFDGSQGDDGPTGFTGSIGFTGSASTAQGPRGFDGSKGDTGFTGSASTVQGPRGFAGSEGVGFTGSAGNNGTTGFNGSRGSQGPDGFTGSAGAENATLASVTSNGNTTSNDISVGGLALSRDVNFSTDIPTPGSAIDLNRTVHSLANGSYSIGNGFDGQIMIFVPRTGTTRNGVSVTFSSIRVSNNANTADPYVRLTNATLNPFNTGNTVAASMTIYIYQDGAWNYQPVVTQ